MAKASAARSPPPDRQGSGGFFDALPDIHAQIGGVGDLFNKNIWDPAVSHFAGTCLSHTTDPQTGKSKKSKSQSRSSSIRASLSRRSTRSARSEGSRHTSRTSTDNTSCRRPPRHPLSSTRQGPPVKCLPGPDSGGPIDIDWSAVIALDQRRMQEQKEEKKKSKKNSTSGSKKSKATSRARKASNRTSSKDGGNGGGGKSIKSRSSRKELDAAATASSRPKKTHRSQNTATTTKSSKSIKTAGSNRSNSASTSATAKSFESSVRSTRSTAQISKISSTAAAKSPSSAVDKSSRREEIRGEVKKKSRYSHVSAAAGDKTKRRRKGTARKSRHTGTGAGTGTVRSTKTNKTAPVRSTVSTNTSHCHLKTRGWLDELRLLHRERPPAAAEHRDDLPEVDNNDDEERESNSDNDSSEDDDSSSDYNANDSSDDDDDAGDGGDDEYESDRETLSKAMRCIGIPLAANFDEDDTVGSKRSERSKRSVKSSKGSGSKVITAAHGSDSGSEIDDAEFYQGSSGDVLAGKTTVYRVIDELGLGTFGRVMKAYEIKRGSFKEKVGLGGFRGIIRPKRSGVVAIKVTRNVAKYKRDAEIEANMLRKVNRSGIRGTQYFPQLVDEFESPMGHHCIVLEKLGMSLYHVLKANGHQPFSTDCVREIGMQVFDALDHLHGIGIIHTDLKPENILLNNNNSKDMRIKLIDLGSAEYERDVNRHSIVNTRQYRAPEILLRIGWSFASDVWAAGCTIAELQLGGLLFAAKEDVEHLALIERILGIFPRWMLLTATAVPDSVASNCFNPVKGTHRMAAVLKPDSVEYVTETEPLAHQLGQVADCISVADVFSEILCIDPMFRPTARLAKELCQSIGNVIQEFDSDDNGDDTD